MTETGKSPSREPANRRLRAARVLDALHAGQRVKLGPHTLAMAEDGRVVVVMHRNDGTEVGAVAYHGLDSFIQDCERISNKDLFILGAERVMTEENRRKAERHGDV